MFFVGGRSADGTRETTLVRKRGGHVVEMVVGGSGCKRDV